MDHRSNAGLGIMKKVYIAKKESKFPSGAQALAIGIFAFLLGCIATTSIVLNVKVETTSTLSTGSSASGTRLLQPPSPLQKQSTYTSSQKGDQPLHARNLVAATSESVSSPFTIQTALRDVRILVVIASFDFSQIPHLEEVLDAYHDLCPAGAAQIDVHIHTTVAYPVTLIDLWNTRYSCTQFSITVVIKNKSLRLHLVDGHRTTFYDNIDKYDLFIYTEDDIRVTPTTVATYLYETRKIQYGLSQLSGEQSQQQQGASKGSRRQKQSKSTHFSNYNVGIVRYEYSYPANVIIDDNTRQATQNVTRVYWEHSGFTRPVVPNAVQRVELDLSLSAAQWPHEFPPAHPVPAARTDDDPEDDSLRRLAPGPPSAQYISMANHHQGMYLATRELLLAWKEREDCHFNVITNRPGIGVQPTQGTQRVWMSSQQLFGRKNCGVIQVLPINSFGALTVLHLPNKNYRRVGKYRNRQFANGSEVFEKPHDSLLTAMEFHLGVRQAWPVAAQFPYRGIRMLDEIDKIVERSFTTIRRMKEYEDYVQRGGVLSKDDMTKTDLAEDET